MILSHPKRWFIVLASLVITMGCALTTAPSNVPASDSEIATAVAATMAVQQGIQSAIEKTVAAAAQPSPTTALPEPILQEPSPTAPSEPTDLPGAGRLVVAYVDAGHNLWVWEETTGGRQITTTGDVSSVVISDDAAWVAFLRTTDQLHYALWAARADGGGEQLLMDVAGFDAIARPEGAISTGPMEFKWVPHTHILAFSTRPFFDGLGLMLNEDLWLANAETGEHNQLLPAGSGGRFYYAPDGTQIALVKPSAISLINADGSNRRTDVLKYTPVLTYSEYQYYAEPHWASDSSFLRVVIPPPAALDNPDDPSTIWDIPIDGTPGAQIGSVRSMPIIYPELSPDLARLAFVQQPGGPSDSQRDLHISQADGTGDTTYLGAPNLMFRGWSPDSTRFLFNSDSDGRPSLGQVGSAAVVVSGAANVDSVMWVDEQRFLFVTRSGGAELRLVTLGGAEQVIYSTADASTPFLEYDFTR